MNVHTQKKKKKKIAKMLFDFLREHNCFGGEHFAQDVPVRLTPLILCVIG